MLCLSGCFGVSVLRGRRRGGAELVRGWFAW